MACGSRYGLAMSQNEEEQFDPAASTQHFRRFVAENKEPEAAARPSVVPYLLVGAVALAVIALIVVLVLWL